ncbi:hypothetical protein [Segeticoccus rhizosphaerae]|uniref:hypothetical protein n=1 Tax=Segeticoccus rhizosphaerae TaxID=1104777 RepID=UPI0012648D04|nr:hypothetical protein [Segeticoccus rhizosphaerae]
MRTTSDERSGAVPDDAAHVWVGAALVGMGQGDTRRAEHAARTGRHVLPVGTRIEVLEVYCSRCRVPYSERACAWPCGGAALRNAVNPSG